MSVEEVVQHILSHSHGLTHEKVMIAIEKKKTASGGFLTDEAAARLVAAEHGVEIKFKKTRPKICIHQLVSGLNDVTLSGRVLLVNMPQAFPRLDGIGQVAWLFIADKTSTIKVVLWNDKAELASKITLGQIVKVLHGYVRRGRDGEMELHVGQRGDIQITPPDIRESDFPSLKDFCEKIANIIEACKKVNVEGVIRTIYPVSTFQRRDGTKGKVVRIVLEDETKWIPVVFWNEKAEQIAKVKEGMTILLMNAKVRKNRQDKLLELHVEGSTNVEVFNSL